MRTPGAINTKGKIVAVGWISADLSKWLALKYHEKGVQA